MKIIDRYIIFSYLKRLIGVFIICMVIFIIQTFWLYIDELAGKGLDFMTIARFLFYFFPRLVPLVLPLSVILASLMTFGSLAEHSEFVAMKSSGVALWRPLTVLVIVHVVIGIGAFIFSNEVIPYGERKSYALRKNLAKKKPALAIREGMFNEVGIYNIKVERMYGQNDAFLEDIIIHQYHPEGKNNLVIKADSGEFSGQTTGDNLQLILYDGNRYEDLEPEDQEARRRFPHTTVNFEKYIMNIDISDINNIDLYQQDETSNYRTYNIDLLNFHIDSLRNDILQRVSSQVINLTATSPISNIQEKNERSNVDTIPRQVLDFVDPNYSYNQIRAVQSAMDELRNHSNILDVNLNEVNVLTRWLNAHIITLHDKFALSFSCVFLFLIGGSLGAIIRKGGIGLPFVLSIFLFLTYHYIGMFAKNAAEDGSISPIIGTWLSTLIVGLLALFLSNRASSDKEVFDLAYFYIRLKSGLIYIPLLVVNLSKKMLRK